MWSILHPSGDILDSEHLDSEVLHSYVPSMTNLLHIDSSIRHEGSVTREVTGAFADVWRSANPEGGYTYRDLNADPIPHVDGTAQGIKADLVAELKAADVILIGAPMYNFSIPSTLKAWIDQVASPEFFPREDGTFELGGKRVVVVTARGGSYKPGTPREGFDFQEPYLRAVLSMIGRSEEHTSELQSPCKLVCRLLLEKKNRQMD